MTTKRRRARRRPSSEATTTQPAAAPQPSPAARRRMGLVEWRWRTFPVFFALAAGMMLGSYLGAIAQAAGNQAALFILTAIAIPFAFGLSRVFNRYVLYGRIIKPRPRR